MRPFFALVHLDPGSAYGLSFPDLPGCFSAADEDHEIIPNAREALDLWFEDQPLIEPRGIEDVRREVVDDLREGAFLIAVPYGRGTAEHAA
jgi:predicted RNase H-like HicB family nuclease